MGIAAVVHLYVFPATPYKRGERCVRNVAVLADYASLGTPPDPEEVQDCERSSRVRFSRQEDRVKTPKLHQSVRDVVIGSGEIVRSKSFPFLFICSFVHNSDLHERFCIGHHPFLESTADVCCLFLDC